MTRPDLTGKRVLVLGAETDLGRAIAAALVEVGARLALVAATTDAEAAFAVQRLARRLAATARAIDATNEMAVRVMVRQVAKQLGGLDAAVFSADDVRGLACALRFGGKELSRGGQGVFVAVGYDAQSVSVPPGVRVVFVKGAGPHDVAAEVVCAVAGETASG